MAQLTDQSVGSPDVVVDGTDKHGYRRSVTFQREFEEAIDSLRRVDSWKNPNGNDQLVADLVLEGGGVKGIGLVGAVLVLSEAGYTFPRVAGTSAGAIAATLIASIGKANNDMATLNGYVRGLDFAK